MRRSSRAIDRQKERGVERHGYSLGPVESEGAIVKAKSYANIRAALPLDDGFMRHHCAYAIAYAIASRPARRSWP